MVPRPVETPQEHCRHVLMYLGELEDQLGRLGLIHPDTYDLFGLLAGARRRCWLAINALESPPDRPRWWRWLRRLARKRGWPIPPPGPNVW